MGRTPKNLPQIQDKRAEVVRLRSQGLTWDQVAERAGYAKGSGALKAWRKAIQQKPDLAVTEIRAAERERLEQMDAVLGGIIASPPAKTTAIGKTVTDPDTGETVRDMSVVVADLRERRQVGESYRRLTAADAAPLHGAGLNEDQVRLMAEVIVRQRDRAQQAPLPALAPLPDNYRLLSPAEQAEAEMNRRRAAYQSQQAAIDAAPQDELLRPRSWSNPARVPME